LKSKEYFKFVVSKIETDFNIYNASSELLKCMYLLGLLKNSDNLLKDIYTISRIKEFKTLGNYLFFILKKTETGKVKFDNLLENLNLDKEFIIKELLNKFEIDNSYESTLPKKDKKDTQKKEIKEKKVTDEIKRILAKSHFKVEEIDNELVTEEFVESNTKEDNDVIVRGNYLELIQPESGFEEESVFSLPINKPESDTGDEVDFLESDVFSLPGDKKEEKITNREIINEQINTKELEEVKLDKILEDTTVEIKKPLENRTIKPVENITEDIIENLYEEEVFAKKETIDEEIVPEETIPQEIINEENILEEVVTEEIIPKEVITEEVIPEKVISEEAMPEEIINEEQVQGTINEEEKEMEIIVNEEPEEINEEEKTVEIENSVYMQYETELMTRNAALISSFDELRNLKKENNNFEVNKDDILIEIIGNSAYMEEYSKKMSFEVITSIYNIINSTFSYYGKTVGEEILNLFQNSINLIESLIKGEDFIGFDNVIKSLEALKHTLLDSKKEETIKQEKEEPPIHTMAKQYDSSERQKLATVKQNILDIENVFMSLDDIKGKFQAYEALRRLSHTFAHLKELVSTANTLEMRKLAQLAEASYIFIKFVQNYRMDPFESEISEVFKYLIYNFKLIFLDKPTKDIDLLISYLNDPVKIFEKKEK
jgi:hypothetical protein